VIGVSHRLIKAVNGDRKIQSEDVLRTVSRESMFVRRKIHRTPSYA